ncbi:MAG: response regulator transcription factor, partial [Chloroflexi bacterium]|nr:response regulator transcription factor [Chloroflexota bacterium]
DDHAVVRAGIRNALDDQPHLHIVGEVGDGPSLLSAIDELQPDLIVTDMTMPGFEPITAVSHIRQQSPLHYFVVVGKRPFLPHPSPFVPLHRKPTRNRYDYR